MKKKVTYLSVFLLLVIVICIYVNNKTDKQGLPFFLRYETEEGCSLSSGKWDYEKGKIKLKTSSDSDHTSAMSEAVLSDNIWFRHSSGFYGGAVGRDVCVESVKTFQDPADYKIVGGNVGELKLRPSSGTHENDFLVKFSTDGKEHELTLEPPEEISAEEWYKAHLSAVDYDAKEDVLTMVFFITNGLDSAESNLKMLTARLSWKNTKEVSWNIVFYGEGEGIPFLLPKR